MSINQDIVIRTNASQSVSELERLGRANRNAISSFDKGIPQMRDFGKEADVTDVKLKGVTASTLALASAYGQLLNVQKMITDVFGGAYQYSTMMENNAIGISAILKSMVKVNGATMQWNESMAMSKNLMSKLRVEALQTASTSADLIETFRGILGPALSQGMTIDQTMEFSKIGVNAVRSLGLPPNQYLQELRSILQGNIRPSSSTLATALGISNEDVKNAKNNAGGVYKFLMDRMAGFERATSETSKTVTGRLAILQEGLFATIEQAGRGIYNDYSSWLKEISDRMFVLNEQTGQISLNPNFIGGTKEILDDFRKISGFVGDVILKLSDNASGIFKSMEMFAMLKGGQWIANSGINALNGFIDKFLKVEKFILGDSIEEKLQAEYEELCLVVEKNKELVESNKENNELLNGISGGVKKLAEYYMSLGVESEKALKWQKQIEGYIVGGASYEEIEKARRMFDEQAKNTQAEQQAQKLEKKIKERNDKIVALEQKREEALKEIQDRRVANEQKFQEQLDKLEEKHRVQRENIKSKIAKEMDDEIINSIKEKEQRLAKVKSDGARWSGGERTINSMTRLEERLIALGMEKEQAQKRVYEINEAILDLNGKDINLIRESVNELVKRAEIEAQGLGIQKEKNELKNQELKSLNSEISRLTEKAKIERGLKREENKVKDFISGKARHTTTDKETGEKTTTKWDEKYIEKAKEMQAVLVEQNIPLEQRNKYISHYINLLAKGKNVEAEMHAQSVISATQSYGARIKEIELSEAYGKKLEELKLKTTQFRDAREKAQLQEINLRIDAINNLKEFEKTEQGASAQIMRALDLIDNKSNKVFSNEENRIKTVIALYKELAAGNMNMAFNMSKGILNAHDNNQGRNVDNEIAEAMSGAAKEIADLKGEKFKRNNDLIREENELREKSRQQIDREREALNKLNQGKEVSKNITNEIIRLSEKEINEQQRAILMYEFKRNAIVGGDQKIIIETDKVIKSVEKEIEYMKKAGREGTESYKALIGIMKSVVQGTLKVDEALLKQMNRFVELEKQSRKTSQELETHYISALGAVGSAIGGLGLAYQSCTNDAESNLGKLAEWAFNGSVVISACESMITALGALRKAYDELSKSALITKAIQTGGPLLARLGGWYGAAALVGAGAIYYASQQDENEVAGRFRDNLEKNRTRNALARKDHPLHDLMEKTKYTNYYQDSDPRSNFEDFKNFDAKTIDLINPSTGGGGSGKGTNSAANKLERLKNQADSAKKSYQELIETVRVANAGKDESQTEFDKKRAELAKKILQWNDKSSELMKKGGEYSLITDKDQQRLKDLIEEYKRLEDAEIERNERIKGYENQLKSINVLESDGLITKRQADKERVSVLKNEIEFYQQLESVEQISLEKRLEYETIIAEKRKALREAEMSETKIQWDSVLEHIKNISFNLTETFNSGIDTMIGRFTDFGQNIIGSTKSVTEQLRELCKNLASDILNMMMKIYLQGLMMNLIGNIFGGGTNISGAGTKYVNNSINSTLGKLDIATNNFTYRGISGTYADGGVAKGWSIVGEKGPELVNFSNPGRVYTADQTKNALSGGNVNIKIDLHNESGTQVEAQTTGSTFDGENYVIGVWLKAVSTNKNGIRNIIKGVVTQ